MVFKPHSPQEGPPVPSLLPKWPWASKTNPATVDSEIESLITSKRAEWEAKGYRLGLIEKALLWAKEWSWGLIKSPIYHDLLEKHPELEVEVTKSLYTTGLQLAENWIKAFSESS